MAWPVGDSRLLRGRVYVVFNRETTRPTWEKVLSEYKVLEWHDLTFGAMVEVEVGREEEILAKLRENPAVSVTERVIATDFH